MTNPVGRPPGRGKVPGSGRKKGSLDKQQRTLISEQLAFDIVKTYKRLGPDWLFKVATERPDLFINQCLSKLLPPAFKEDQDAGTTNNTININNMSEMESARRVAFALAKAAYQLDGEPAPAIEVNITPQWRAPSDAPDLVPEFEDRPLFQPDRGEPVTRTLETLGGGAGEQGGSTPRRSDAPTATRTVNEIRRDQLRAKRDRLL